MNQGVVVLNQLTEWNLQKEINKKVAELNKQGKRVTNVKTVSVPPSKFTVTITHES